MTKKFKIGDKVIPLTKTIWCELDDSQCWKRAKGKNQGFLYVIGFESDGTLICGDNKSSSGDFFKESDLVLYTEDKTEELINKLESLVGEASDVISLLKESQKNKVAHARQQIINEAKAFVEKYQAVRKGQKGHSIGNETARSHFYETDLVTKGTRVTAVVYRLKGGTKRTEKSYEVGRAKCATGDTFNRHIGEAIALGRALGINVDKFTSAVQPTNYVEGQVVKGVLGKIVTITKINGATFDMVEFPNKFAVLSDIRTIIDDTNAVYKADNL